MNCLGSFYTRDSPVFVDLLIYMYNQLSSSLQDHTHSFHTLRYNPRLFCVLLKWTHSSCCDVFPLALRPFDVSTPVLCVSGWEACVSITHFCIFLHYKKLIWNIAYHDAKISWPFLQEALTPVIAKTQKTGTSVRGGHCIWTCMAPQLPELEEWVYSGQHVQILEHMLLKLSPYVIHLYQAKHEFMLAFPSNSMSHRLSNPFLSTL